MPEKCKYVIRYTDRRAPRGGIERLMTPRHTAHLAHECAHTGATPTHPHSLTLSLLLML